MRSPPRLRPPIDLKTIQLVYSIGMGAGLLLLVESVYLLCSEALGVATAESASRGTAAGSPGGPLPIIACHVAVASLLLLGLRFFWAVTNVRRLAEDRTVDETSTRNVRRMIVMVHVPMLMLHVLAYYFACRLLADVCRRLPSGRGPLMVPALYAACQVVNAIWLLFLVRNRTRCLRERRWMVNNFVISGIGLAGLALGVLQKWNEYAVLLACSAVFIVGSIVDCFFTSYHYLEDPETFDLSG